MTHVPLRRPACDAEGAPGEPVTTRGPECGPALHPLAPILAVAALVAGWATWNGRPRLTLGPGGAMLLLGLLYGFRAGFYGIGAGSRLLAAGGVQWVGQRRPASGARGPRGP